MTINQLEFLTTLTLNGETYQYFDLIKFSKALNKNISDLPFSIRILIENCLRNMSKIGFSEENAVSALGWEPKPSSDRAAVPFLPARVLMQDFTGVPVLNDLTALRAAVKKDGKDPKLVNPRIPSNLVTDHSLQVQSYGCDEARRINEKIEFDQNFERYQFLKWSQNAFDNLQVLPPGLGICHQVNLEHLSQVAFVQEQPDGERWIYPDSVLGTDSHTTMVNGLGVLGWGVGGIEALAAMLDYPSEFTLPDVVGLELTGKLPDHVTPTDLTLTITSKLRELDVVGKFVEVFGKSVPILPVETRAMISNMSPESGSTMTYFPVDEQTISYLERTGRSTEHTQLVKDYFQKQALFNSENGTPINYSQTLTIDLDSIEPVLSGPKRPQDVFSFSTTKTNFKKFLTEEKGLQGYGISQDKVSDSVEVKLNGEKCRLAHGSVLIAAITSCTNTSDPTVMISAALLAKRAFEIGLRSKPWVKTSFAPGSRVVEAYLNNADLMSGLDGLGFNIVGYGCTTCIGNSGPIMPDIVRVVQDNNLVCASVLSGNRNFEGRIHPTTLANFLATPPLVVAYALAGTMDFDFEIMPLGTDQNGNPVFLRDIYPEKEEVDKLASEVVLSDLYTTNYANIYDGNPRWNAMEVPNGDIFNWEPSSTILKEPDFLFDGFGERGGLSDIHNARVLAVLGDSITTDHISPAGRIALDNPSAIYLNQHAVKPENYISFGARRGNHEVMERGTFSNPRLHNKLSNGKDGGYTTYIPTGEVLSIFDAAQRYKEQGIPLIILTGKAYGAGSSRDWAAKGTYLLGVQAVIAESYERIHRTNLVGLGILPLQFTGSESVKSLKLTGLESFSIEGIEDIDQPKGKINVTALRNDGSSSTFATTIRIDTPLELAYFKAGGLMRKVRSDI